MDKQMFLFEQNRPQTNQAKEISATALRKECGSRSLSSTFGKILEPNGQNWPRAPARVMFGVTAQVSACQGQ